jgi:hypothetical protein
MFRFDPPAAPALKLDKGLFGGSCNRRACQRPGATWFNHSTRAHYCEDCAQAINRANPDTWVIGLDGPLCVPVSAAST